MVKLINAITISKINSNNNKPKTINQKPKTLNPKPLTQHLTPKNMTHLKVGDKAPSFSGTDQNGKQHSLADYKGKKLVVKTKILNNLNG